MSTRSRGSDPFDLPRLLDGLASVEYIIEITEAIGRPRDVEDVRYPRSILKHTK